MTTNRIAMWTLVAGLAAGAAYGQSDPYGPPGSQGQPGQYGQQGQYEDDWNESEDWYERQSRDDYDRNDPNGGYGGYDDRGRAPGVDVGFFYGELSPYGEWVRHPYYGWVWFPRHVHAGWRPYSVGRWVESDYGWTWVSYEPFGWATYHYGRWAWDRYVGWLWVPGTDWGPAWVAWQQGNGYIGWAPLPPAVGFDLRVGIQLGGFNLSFGIAPRNYAFVDERRFLDTRIGGYIVPEARNVTIIHNTTNITNYTVVDNRVINHGVPVERVERVTGRRAQRLRVAAQTSSRATSVERDVVRIYRPAETKLESVKVAKRNNAGLRREAAKEPKSKAQAPAPTQAPANRPPATSKPGKQDAQVPIAVAPRAQPTPKKVDEREFVREQKELQSNQQKKQRELEQLQRQENAQSPAKGKPQPAVQSNEKGAQGTPKASAQDIQKRHAAELQEQKVLRERTAEQLKTRQQIQRQAAQASAEKAKAPAKAQGEQPKQGEKAKKGKGTEQQEKSKKNQNEDEKPPRSF